MVFVEFKEIPVVSVSRNGVFYFNKTAIGLIIGKFSRKVTIFYEVESKKIGFKSNRNNGQGLKIIPNNSGGGKLNCVSFFKRFNISLPEKIKKVELNKEGEALFTIQF